MLAVGLGSEVYFWNESTSAVSQLRSAADQGLITSLSWQEVCLEINEKNELFRNFAWCSAELREKRFPRQMFSRGFLAF